ncbi:glycosyl transferase [Paenibacillus chartarius]|uniref:Glycosyl transferase n=1 Tax=Paenibacillus chartarius TaxID=747481 RepID=A0ABV6DIA7_9BACL
MSRNVEYPNFLHLERLTDGTGLLEHALGRIPRRREGYTTDDNARALWACLAWLEIIGNDPSAAASRMRLLRLTETYAAFLLWAQEEDGSFHNNFYYDRTPEPEQASDDCLGRALWAAACACSHAGLSLAAEQLLLRGLPHIESITAARGWAYALSACSLLIRSERQGRLPGISASLREQIRCRCTAYMAELESRLLQLFEENARPDWNWLEPVMTYGNGVLPWSLLQAFATTGNTRSLETGLALLDFLAERMTAPSPQGWIRPIGNRGWCTPDDRAIWDQQPLDVMKLALAAEQAYAVKERQEHLALIAACRDWFHGRNDAGASLADPKDGSCCDGLTASGRNDNCGAESTLSYLLTEAIYARTFGGEGLNERNRLP